MLVYDSDCAALYQGDSLEVLQSFADDSFDMILCSPPYEAARTYGIGFSLSGQDWVDWAVARYLECVRVCRGLVAWVVEGRTHQFRYSASPLLLAADLHRRGVKLRKPPIYRRVGIPGSGGPDWVRNDYEFIICASKGKLPYSDNTAMGEECKHAVGGAMSYRNGDGVRKNERIGSRVKLEARRKVKMQSRRKPNGERAMDGEYVAPDKANPGNVIQERYTAQDIATMLGERGDIVDCKVGGGLMGSKLSHENEAPFPESLAEFLIKSFCKPNGLLLDCFCGSGTSIAAAIKCGRNAVGVDLRESQIDLSKRRIAEALAVAA